MASPFRLEQLDTRHDVEGFASGRETTDSYFKDRAIVEQSLGFASVTVAVDAKAPTAGQPASVPVVGFFSLSPTSIRVDDRLLTAVGLPAVPYAALGGYLLGQLGVQEKMRGKRIGAALVAEAVRFAREGRVGTGGVFLAVDAEEENLIGFYAKLGFTRLHSGTLKMVMRL